MEQGPQIYTFNVSEPFYAMHWSAKEDRNFRLALGSFKHDKSNHIQVVTLNEAAGTFQFEPGPSAHHGFAATKVMFAPSSCSRDLLATSSEALRIWRVDSETLVEEALLIPDSNPIYTQPLTSFDWGEAAYIGTCSIDRSCTIWNVERQCVEKQLIAHNEEVNDLAWSPTPGRFATVSSDGSVRVFDMRHATNSSVIYENTATPLVRVTWNKQDPRYLATVAKDARIVVIVDLRYPSYPVAELDHHTGAVNAMAWAPHSSCHICTVGDDCQVLIWDLKDIRRPTDRSLSPILSYEASSEVLQVHWSAGRPDWIAISFENMAQILRV